ncbi:hypothetical protein RKD38_000848 [Streptomyces ambofaciens]
MPGAAVRGRGSVRPLEADCDVIIVDCPPSLGIAMDAALYYGRRRRGEAAGGSGVVIPVLAEDSSATAYGMLAQQIEDLCEDLSLDIDYLGLVVNLFDSCRGYFATSSLDNWKSLGDPKVLAIVGDLKEQREAVCSPAPFVLPFDGERGRVVCQQAEGERSTCSVVLLDRRPGPPSKRAVACRAREDPLNAPDP